MAAINFYLKGNTVYARINNGRTFESRITTGIRIEKPTHWSKSKRVILSADKSARTKNNLLADFKDKVLNIVYETPESMLNASYIKQQIEAQKQGRQKLSDFWQLFEIYRESKSTTHRKRTKQKLDTLKVHLYDFENTLPFKLDVHTIDRNKLSQFRDWMYNDKGFRTATTARYIAYTKMFLNFLLEEKIITNSDWKLFKNRYEPDSIKVIFTDDEIEKLRAYNGKDFLENARDIVMIGILTGLRYGDIARITRANVEGDILTIRQEKTQAIVQIPLSGESKQLIDKLITKQLRMISNQRLNQFMKELAEACNINSPVEKTIFKGNLTTNVVKPKFEMVSYHTTRRTFCTRLLLKGVPAQVVMKFSGHRDYKSFRKYVNIPAESETEMVRNALGA